MKVICFGDSNTFGYDPRSWLGGRYNAAYRWVDILAAKTGWTFINNGMNGREIPSVIPDFPVDTDLLILMLGTNELLQGCGYSQTAVKLERFLRGLALEPNKILLIAPPPLTLGEWVMDSRLIDDSIAFAGCCRVIAQRLKVRFTDAGIWNIDLAFDGVHFSEQGHMAFAAGLLAELR